MDIVGRHKYSGPSLSTDSASTDEHLQTPSPSSEGLSDMTRSNFQFGFMTSSCDQEAEKGPQSTPQTWTDVPSANRKSFPVTSRMPSEDSGSQTQPQTAPRWVPAAPWPLPPTDLIIHGFWYPQDGSWIPYTHQRPTVQFILPKTIYITTVTKVLYLFPITKASIQDSTHEHKLWATREYYFLHCTSFTTLYYCPLYSGT